jgi:hypothetical protein
MHQVFYLFDTIRNSNSYFSSRATGVGVGVGGWGVLTRLGFEILSLQIVVSGLGSSSGHMHRGICRDPACGVVEGDDFERTKLSTLVHVSSMKSKHADFLLWKSRRYINQKRQASRRHQQVLQLPEQ